MRMKCNGCGEERRTEVLELGGKWHVQVTCDDCCRTAYYDVVSRNYMTENKKKEVHMTRAEAEARRHPYMVYPTAWAMKPEGTIGWEIHNEQLKLVVRPCTPYSQIQTMEPAEARAFAEWILKGLEEVTP